MTILRDPGPPVRLDELHSLDHPPDWDAMEARLVKAMADRPRAGAASVVSIGRRAWLRRHPGWRAMTAAAGLVLAAAITFYTPPTRRDIRLPAAVGASQTSSAPAPPAAAPAPAPDAPAAPAAPVRRLPITRATPSAPLPQAERLDGFVALPGAAALPDFESGRIVRLEVPWGALPAYGIALAPDAWSAPVQAEFLVGQDGVARAIRLASSSLP